MTLSFNNQQTAETNIVHNDSVRKIVSNRFEANPTVKVISLNMDSSGDCFAGRNCQFQRVRFAELWNFDLSGIGIVRANRDENLWSFGDFNFGETADTLRDFFAVHFCRCGQR